MSSAVRQEEASRPVSTLELFFDLVFVFAITQLTALLADDHTPRGAFQVLLIFGVMWWMFGGYVWLTNAVAPDRPLRKLLLLAAMAGFLVIGLAVPTAFEAGGGLVFALGFLFVVLIHSGLFLSAQKGSSIIGMLRVAPLNIVAAFVLIGASFLEGPIVYALWVLALGIAVLISFVAVPAGFTIQARHFVERHGLLLIIVLGESIVAISVGAADLALDASLLVAGTLALALVSCLWWLYFNEDDARAEEAISAAPMERRIRIALNAFFYAQIPMLLGVVTFAAGVKSVIAHAFDPLEPYAAAFLAVGVALYLLGDALFRLGIGFGHANLRAAGAVAALLSFPVGITLSATVQLSALLVLLLAVIVVHPRRVWCVH
jgi:low temperature requirement protein LtrA